MIAVADKLQSRLTMQTVEIAPNTTAIRSLDWDRDRFDIEFGLQTALLTTHFASWRPNSLSRYFMKISPTVPGILVGLIDPAKLDYLIIAIPNPTKGLLKMYWLFSGNRCRFKVATSFKNWVHQPFEHRIRKCRRLIWVKDMSWNLSSHQICIGQIPYSTMPKRRFSTPVMHLGCTIATITPLMKS